MSYAPLDSGFLHSTVIGYGPDVVAVWTMLLASKDRYDETEITAPAMARLLGVDVGRIDAALKVLSSPDTHSRNQDFAGRRILERGGGKWFVVSGEKYRSKASAANAADRKRRWDEEHRKSRSNMSDFGVVGETEGMR